MSVRQLNMLKERENKKILLIELQYISEFSVSQTEHYSDFVVVVGLRGVKMSLNPMTKPHFLVKAVGLSLELLWRWFLDPVLLVNAII